MSRHDSMITDYYVVCPYCEYTYQPEGDEAVVDDAVMECESCGKKYRLMQEYTLTSHTTPDCELNEAAHDWEQRTLRDGSAAEFCLECCKARLLGGGEV